MNASVRLEEARRSKHVGFSLLTVWLCLGFVLELAHAFKWSPYLDLALRRELLTWAHVHGVGLALVVLAYAAVGIHPALSDSVGSRLRAGALLMPAGFLLAIVGHGESDPGPAILAVPVGALLVLSSLFEIARAAKHEANN